MYVLIGINGLKSRGVFLSTGKKSAEKAQTKDKKKGFIRIEAAVTIAIVCAVAGYLLHALFGDLDLRPKKKEIDLSFIQSDSSDKSAQQDLKSTIKTLEDTAAKNPDSADAWTRLGNAYFDSDQYEKAISAYKKSLEINSGNPDVWTDMGVMYRRSGRPLDAVKAFEKASVIDPKHELSLFNKGIVLLHDLSDEKGAREVWEKLLALNPQFTSPSGVPLKTLVDNLK